MFYFHPYLGKWSNLTNISHQLAAIFDSWITQKPPSSPQGHDFSWCLAAWLPGTRTALPSKKMGFATRAQGIIHQKKSHGNLQSTINEDVFPIENGDFPASHVRFLGGPYSGTHTWRWDYRKLESLEIGLNFQGVVHVLLGTPPKKRTRNLKIPPWKRINKNTNHQFWGSMLIFGCIHSGNQT